MLIHAFSWFQTNFSVVFLEFLNCTTVLRDQADPAMSLASCATHLVKGPTLVRTAEALPLPLPPLPHSSLGSQPSDLEQQKTQT